ncbi:hypothetical protein A7982_13926 [Minicystis rosea]|nr:hypothetical protein A7982_13926 [Minicystis rosea]
MIIVYQIGNSWGGGHLAAAFTSAKTPFLLSWGRTYKPDIVWGAFDPKDELKAFNEKTFARWCKIPTVEDGNAIGLSENMGLSTWLSYSKGQEGRRNHSSKGRFDIFVNNCSDAVYRILVYAGSSKFAWWYGFPWSNPVSVTNYAKRVKRKIKDALQTNGWDVKYGRSIEEIPLRDNRSVKRLEKALQDRGRLGGRNEACRRAVSRVNEAFEHSLDPKAIERLTSKQRMELFDVDPTGKDADISKIFQEIYNDKYGQTEWSSKQDYVFPTKPKIESESDDLIEVDTDSSCECCGKLKEPWPKSRKVV